jgi:hypothetical protein
MHGHHRLLRIGVDAALRRKWNDGVQELSGMFLDFDSGKAETIVRMIDLFLRCAAAMAEAGDEPKLVKCEINEGKLEISAAEQGWTKLVLDLSKWDQS